MAFVFTEENLKVLELASNGETRYGIATLSEAGISESNKIHITVPSAEFWMKIEIQLANLTVVKRHSYVCVCIAFETITNEVNRNLKTRNNEKILIRDLTYA
eukprot:GHVP01024308.1.p1 GENE.GHVP01024308.1~~GHVP01024308.1.p1  ORF type:complete len:102 (-),score=9.63 GHVP01024308.1:618-923(-)